MLQPPIRLTGHPRVSGANRRLSTKHYCLLARLAGTEGQAVERVQLAALLWPESRGATARHSLSQALYVIKSALRDPQLIIADATQLSLAVGASDIGGLKRAGAIGDWHRFARLCSGDLLEGLDFTQLPEFEAWLNQERASMHRYIATASESMFLEGQRDVAADLAAIIHSEHDSFAPRASFAEEAAVDSVRGGAVLPFVGRHSELERLEECYELVQKEGPRLASIEGEGGVGKTALLDRFVRLRALRGSIVIAANAYEAEKNVPFGVVGQWLQQIAQRSYLSYPDEPWLSVLVHAFPFIQLGSGGDHGRANDDVVTAQQQLFEAIRRLFEQVTRHSPLVVALDDSQHADAASLGFVHYLTRNSVAPIMCVATSRTGPARTRRLFSGWKRIDRICLPPLNLGEVDHLLEQLDSKGDTLAWTSEQLLRLTGGNSLLLSAVLTSRRFSASHQETPPSVFDFFRPKLESLSGNARLLLGGLAVLGEPVEFEIAAQAAGVSAPTPALAELAHEGLIIERDNRITVRHGLIVDVVLSELHPAERRQLHGRAARVLSAEARVSPALVAVQHDIAGNSSEAYAAALRAAAASRVLFAHREREFFLKLALSHAPDAATAARARTQLGILLIDQGRSTEAQEVLAQHWFGEVPQRTCDIARAHRHIAILAGARDPTEIDRALETADELTQRIPCGLLGELFGAIASAAHSLGLGRRAATAAGAALANLERVPGRVDAKRAYRAVTVLGFYTGYQDALSRLDRLLPATRCTPPEKAIRLCAEAALLVSAGRLYDAEKMFLETLELAERYGLYDQLFALRNNLGVCYMEQGRYSEAQVEFETALQYTKEGIATPGDGAIVLDNLTILEFEKGDFARCRARSSKALASGIVRSGRGIFAQISLRGLAALELGKLAEAFESRRELVFGLEQFPYWSADMSYVEIFLARMATLENQTKEAISRLEKAVRVYHDRDLLVRARVELELMKLTFRQSPGATLNAAERLLGELTGSGAHPLIERAERMRYRAHRVGGC